MAPKITEIEGKALGCIPTTAWISPYIIKGTIDLGLSIGEAVRILGVYMMIKLGLEFNFAGFHQVHFGLSFDPDQSTPAIADDAIFARLDHSIAQETGTAEAAVIRGIQKLYDFERMNLITTRNIGMVAEAECDFTTTQEVQIMAMIYYERFVPTPNDLNMLIATRR
ncbi:hypothetical protein ES703_119826 [subsurface metagenome]